MVPLINSDQNYFNRNYWITILWLRTEISTLKALATLTPTWTVVIEATRCHIYGVCAGISTVNATATDVPFPL